MPSSDSPAFYELMLFRWTSTAGHWRSSERNAVAQSQLVEDLLDVSGIASGRFRIAMQPVPVSGPLREAIETMKPAAAAKRVTVGVESDQSVGTVSADPGRLQQVFWNLVSNAIKFTSPGGHVAVALQSEAGFARVTVRDSGIGIPLEFLPHVFEPFRQADARFARNFGGLGLGLSITKQLVELHGGTLTAESDGPGRGAAFTVRLPVLTKNSVLVAAVDVAADDRYAAGRCRCYFPSS
jgi:signal transduction histidine kinase